MMVIRGRSNLNTLRCQVTSDNHIRAAAVMAAFLEDGYVNNLSKSPLLSMLIRNYNE